MRIRRIAVMVASLTFVSAAAAHAGSPTQFIQTKVREVRALLAVKVVADSKEADAVDKKLSTLIDPLLMFDRMSENALRSHWPTLNKAQKSKFIALFRALVFRSYLNRIRGADEAYTIEYEARRRKAEKRRRYQLSLRQKRQKSSLCSTF